MNRKKDKWNRIILLLIISILMIVLIMNLQRNDQILNNEHLALASTIIRNKVNTTSEKILHGKTIVIDAGHGGIDIGSSGQNGTIEKDVTHKLRLGRCYDSNWEIHGVAGSCPIIANSFTELLERLVMNNGKHWYWLQDDFTSLGDAYDE